MPEGQRLMGPLQRDCFVGTPSTLQTRVRATYWLKQSERGPGPGMVLVALGRQGLVGAGRAAWVLLAPPEPPTVAADPGQVWAGHKADALPAGLSLWPLFFTLVCGETRAVLGGIWETLRFWGSNQGPLHANHVLAPSLLAAFSEPWEEGEAIPRPHHQQR